jgi:hypothetical protein
MRTSDAVHRDLLLFFFRIVVDILNSFLVFILSAHHNIVSQFSQSQLRTQNATEAKHEQVRLCGTPVRLAQPLAQSETQQRHDKLEGHSLF